MGDTRREKEDSNVVSYIMTNHTSNSNNREFIRKQSVLTTLHLHPTLLRVVGIDGVVHGTRESQCQPVREGIKNDICNGCLSIFLMLMEKLVMLQ